MATPSLSFAERLRTSQVLEVNELAAAQEAVGDDEPGLVEYLLGRGLLTRFQVRQLRAGATSFAVGKYVVVDCIGRGAGGIVFKARHRLMPNRYVALKTVDTRNLHHGSEAVARFRREIDIVTRLDHPNVVRALDVVQTRTHLYLVLEYVAGKDLACVVKERGPLPVGEAVHYAVQAARGLQYAHASGVIHRDLKPANLLLTDSGVVKLSDLGLARLFTQEDEGLTLKGMALGTPEFMAPEQAEDASSAGVRSDLYSLGATLFHLLTGELPVGGSSYLHRLQTLLTLPPRPLRQARSEVPEALADVVDRLRARDPRERPTCTEDAIALLEPFAAAPTPVKPSEWDGKRKAALVLEVLRGQSKAEVVCSRHGLSAAELEAWQRRFLEAGERALDPNAAPDRAAEQLRELHAKIGAQAMEFEALKKRLSGLLPRPKPPASKGKA
jgi:serine/threonine-protein kinase